MSESSPVRLCTAPVAARLQHARHPQQHAARHGWRGRDRDGGCALTGYIDGHAHRNIERSRIPIADARSIGSRSFRYACILPRLASRSQARRWCLGEALVPQRARFHHFRELPAQDRTLPGETRATPKAVRPAVREVAPACHYSQGMSRVWWPPALGSVLATRRGQQLLRQPMRGPFTPLYTRSGPPLAPA